MTGSVLTWRSDTEALPIPGEYVEDLNEFGDEKVNEFGHEPGIEFSAEVNDSPGCEPVAVSARGKTRAGTGRSASKLAGRDRLVMDNLLLVKAIGLRVHETLPVHVELDDLVHAGVIGLIDAASKFDARKQVSFANYAKHRIRGAIIDSLRQLDWASRDLRRRHKQLEAATRDLGDELQRVPTEAEIASRLGVDVDRWRQMMIDLRHTGLISANTRATDHDELPEPEFADNGDSQPDLLCAREQIKSAIGNAMTRLPDRYKQVVVMYYTNEMTMKEIGGVLGINESRVSQIHKSALEKMQTALQETGIHSSAAF